MADTRESIYQISSITICENRKYRELHYKSDESLIRKLLKEINDDGETGQLSVESIIYHPNFGEDIEIGPNEFVNDKQRALKFKRVITDSPLETL